MSINILHWKCVGGNWGDDIALSIAKHICGHNNINLYDQYTINDIDGLAYTIVGSINQSIQYSNTIIWGSGFIFDYSSKNKMWATPKKVCAVRGPLSRNVYLRHNIECPEIYGDPALLISRYYNPPNVKKQYDYGIIPHHIDKKNNWLNQFKETSSFKILDIQNSKSFIDDLLKCNVILSSSLHGLIASDSYGIPSYWIKLSNSVLGNGFKFRDYFLSVNRPVLDPIIIKGNEKILDLAKSFYEYKISIDLDKLLEVCPFKDII